MWKSFFKFFALAVFITAISTSAKGYIVTPVRRCVWTELNPAKSSGNQTIGNSWVNDNSTGGRFVSLGTTGNTMSWYEGTNPGAGYKESSPGLAGDGQAVILGWNNVWDMATYTTISTPIYVALSGSNIRYANDLNGPWTTVSNANIASGADRRYSGWAINNVVNNISSSGYFLTTGVTSNANAILYSSDGITWNINSTNNNGATSALTLSAGDSWASITTANVTGIDSAIILLSKTQGKIAFLNSGFNPSSSWNHVANLGTTVPANSCTTSGTAVGEWINGIYNPFHMYISLSQYGYVVNYEKIGSSFFIDPRSPQYYNITRICNSTCTSCSDNLPANMTRANIRFRNFRYNSLHKVYVAEYYDATTTSSSSPRHGIYFLYDSSSLDPSKNWGILPFSNTDPNYRNIALASTGWVMWGTSSNKIAYANLRDCDYTCPQGQGQYLGSVSNTNSCSNCQGPFYSNDLGTSCYVCPNNYIDDTGTGKTTTGNCRINCAAGYYVTATAQSCACCPDGKFCNNMYALYSGATITSPSNCPTPATGTAKTTPVCASANTQCYVTGMTHSATYCSGTKSCYFTSGNTYNTNCFDSKLTSCPTGYYDPLNGAASASANDGICVGNDYYSASGSITRTGCAANTKSSGCGNGAGASTDCVAFVKMKNSKKIGSNDWIALRQITNVNANVNTTMVKPRLCARYGNETYCASLRQNNPTGNSLYAQFGQSLITGVKMMVSGSAHFLTNVPNGY